MAIPRFVLFGDSLTQQSFSPGGWAASLAHHYARKADVVLRGFSGYNTRWALFLLPAVFPLDSSDPPLLVTVFFGANDAVLAHHLHNEKHVPLQEYKENLLKIISHVKGVCQSTHVVLITPPPVDKKGLQVTAVRKYAAGPEDPPSRSNEVTGTYTKACIEVGQERGIPVIDLWSSMQQQVDWEIRYLSDGLHLSPEGNAFVFENLLQVLDKIGLSSRNMALDFPEFFNIDPNEPKRTFQDV